MAKPGPEYAEGFPTESQCVLCLRGREPASSQVKSSRGPFSLLHEKPQSQPLVHKWKPPHSPSDEQPYGAGPLPRPFRRPALLLAGWAEPGRLVPLSRPLIRSPAKQGSALGREAGASPVGLSDGPAPAAPWVCLSSFTCQPRQHSWLRAPSQQTRSEIAPALSL